LAAALEVTLPVTNESTRRADRRPVRAIVTLSAVRSDADSHCPGDIEITDENVGLTVRVTCPIDLPMEMRKLLAVAIKLRAG
jgi:hypothetical protein